MKAKANYGSRNRTVLTVFSRLAVSTVPGIERKSGTSADLTAVRYPLLASTLVVVLGGLCVDEVAAGENRGSMSDFCYR